MGKEKKRVIYLLPHIDRIGELALQLFALRNLFHEREFDITVITFPLHINPRANRALFNIATRGVDVVYSGDSKLLWSSYHDRQNRFVVRRGNVTYVLVDNSKLWAAFAMRYFGKEPKYHYSLNYKDHRKVEQLRDKFGIPRHAPIATLHVREAGYLKGARHHDFRDAKIENYIPAIEYLVEKGFFVVRLGDKSMKRFKNAPKEFIDTPFHRSYTDEVEPYFIAMSKFYIGMPSGPISIAQGFGIPILSTNALVQGWNWLGSRDLYIYKKYYSKRLERYLTCEEILLSPAVDFCRTEQFEKGGVEIIENSAIEILTAVKEMEERLDGRYLSEEGERIAQKARKVEAKAHYVRKHTIPDTIWTGEQNEGPFMPSYSLFWSNAQLSHEYVKMNPYFLGHDWEAG